MHFLSKCEENKCVTLLGKSRARSNLDPTPGFIPGVFEQKRTTLVKHGVRLSSNMVTANLQEIESKKKMCLFHFGLWFRLLSISKLQSSRQRTRSRSDVRQQNASQPVRHSDTVSVFVSFAVWNRRTAVFSGFHIRTKGRAAKK